MRILLVSDTHLGFDLPQRPRVKRRRRGPDFFDNFERALQPAFNREVDVVVHGGDLLYRSRVPAGLVEAALAPLKRVAASGIPVLLVPGNHERGRLPYPLLALHDRLHVFHAPGTLVVQSDGITVAFSGFPYVRDVRSQFTRVLAAARHATAPADVRILCMHQCVEGATCGPGNFVFRDGGEVIRARDLPGDVAVVLSGHIHRHQVLRIAGRPPVIYAGSIERTSFAEAPETKGYVLLDVTRSGLCAFEFRALPARPMLVRHLAIDDLGREEGMAQVAGVIASTRPDAVLQLRVHGAAPAWLTAAALRRLGGDRNVGLAVSRRDASSPQRRYAPAGSRRGDDPPLLRGFREDDAGWTWPGSRT